jgi:prepilin-type N-terminal cleavage/methylation domain-containing protein
MMLPRKSLSNFSPKGFTLIELVIVVGILGILLVSAFAVIQLFTGQVNLDTTSQQVLSSLQLARNRTLSSTGEMQHGVHFETSKYVLFEGDTYSAVDPANQEFNLTQVEIYEINITGGSDVVFDRIRGTTSNNGNVKIRLTADNSKTETILVNSSGSLSLQESVSPSDTRVVDTRHLHFDLGWSIQGASTLTLDFPDDSHMESIPMAAFFDAGSTVFSWEGTVEVDGVDQTIRVHTHSLDASDTTLSIHRDRQKNDKALDISIDGNDIVSFTAVGAASVGNFGGTMTVQ